MSCAGSPPSLPPVLGGAFVLSAGPFVIRTLRTDPLVGLIALPMTLVSAVAAAAGLMCGTLQRELIMGRLTKR